MADLGAIRQGMANALEAITDVQVSPVLLADPTPPLLQVYPAEVTFDGAANRGMDEFEFVVEAVMPFSTDIGSQVELDKLMAGSGPRSVKQALEADDSLGGTCQDVQVTRISDYGVAQRPDGLAVLACRFYVHGLVLGTS